MAPKEIAAHAVWLIRMEVSHAEKVAARHRAQEITLSYATWRIQTALDTVATIARTFAGMFLYFGDSAQSECVADAGAEAAEQMSALQRQLFDTELSGIQGHGVHVTPPAHAPAQAMPTDHASCAQPTPAPGQPPEWLGIDLAASPRDLPDQARQPHTA